MTSCNSFYFYIKPQHHHVDVFPFWCCNSFYFYIKPQPITKPFDSDAVVIHSISTSNHNSLPYEN